MSQIKTIQTTAGVDYFHWLKHELLTIREISVLAKGLEPTPINTATHTLRYSLHSCKIASILTSACKAGSIKTYSNNNASPIECLLYLKHMDIPLPTDLLHVLENDIEDIQKYLNAKIKGKRTKESYQRKETRDDKAALLAVLKTLLDLAPELPKDDLVQLKPVQEYANGHKYNPKYLKKLISEIEGKSRNGGNRNKSKTESIKRSIPQSWIKFETGSDHI